MDQALILSVAAEFGATQDVLQGILRAPYDRGVFMLKELKVLARSRYKKLAFEYHPDRNQGNPSAEARFKALAEVLRHIEGLELRRPAPPPVQVFVQMVRVPVRTGPISTGYFSTDSSTTTTVTYDARRVVFVRG